MKVNGILSAIKTTMGGLSSQMKRMNVISENIANAERSADKDGKVYQKKVVTFDPVRKQHPRNFSDQVKLQLARTSSDHIPLGQPCTKR